MKNNNKKTPNLTWQKHFMLKKKMAKRFNKKSLTNLIFIANYISSTQLLDFLGPKQD